MFANNKHLLFLFVMKFFFSDITRLKLKILLFLVFCPCFFLTGQEFEWVYTIESNTNINNLFSQDCRVEGLTTGNNGEIYAVVQQYGHHRFEIGDDEVTLGTGNSAAELLIIKLDENKNTLWAKQLKGGHPRLRPVVTDADGNVLISGNIKPRQQVLFFDPNPPNPLFPNILEPTHEGLDNTRTYGFVVKLDSEGNYIDSRLYEDIWVAETAVDNNDIIVTGYTSTTAIRYAYIAKYKSNFDIAWEKTYSGTNSNEFTNIVTDSQGNIYCQGVFRNAFTFGSTSLQNPASEFICKMTPEGNEEWLIGLSNSLPELELSNPSVYRKKLRIDTSDQLYFYTAYSEAQSYQFNNVVINDLPLSGNTYGSELVLFKTDSDGNYIYHISLYGADSQEIKDFGVTSDEELLLLVNPNFQDLYYTGGVIGVENNNALLLKTDVNGELADFKRLDVEGAYGATTLNIDTDNYILIGGYIHRPTDFDPHPFNEHIIEPLVYTPFGTDSESTEFLGFILKLSNCDSEFLFSDSYNFCTTAHPSPTIGDIIPNEFNISWYDSMSSQIPLEDDFELLDGQTYYVEKIAGNCPNLMRQPVLITISDSSTPPVFDAVQPCYYEGMTFADLNIHGENLTFYTVATEGTPTNPDFPISPNNTYYVSQQIEGCESERIAINITALPLLAKTHTAYICDNGSLNPEAIDLSYYVPYFMAPNQTGFSVSYHSSYDEAFNGTNPIGNYQNYQPTVDQSVYFRFYLEQYGCFEVTELMVGFSVPPEISEIQVNDLTGNNTITVLPDNENYLYSLDGILYQNSNYFENLPSGEYQVYVKDSNTNCQPVTTSVYVLSYPKFFTPNADGINDYWRIKFAREQEVLNVEIYDRYGKLITFFDKNSIGWDGTYNGKTLPATDYWFRIIRISDQKIIYRGHFSLIR